MANIIGLYHGKRPVLEIRKGEMPFWKSPGWTTPNTSIGLATTINLSNTTGDIVKTWGNGFAQKGTDGTTWTVYDDDLKQTGTFSFSAGAWPVSSVDINHQYFTMSNGGGTSIFKTSDLSKPIADSKPIFYVDQTVALEDGSVFVKTNGGGSTFRNTLHQVVGGIINPVTPSYSANYAISAYDGYFYSYQANGDRAKINKMDGKGNILVTATPNKKTVTEVTISNPGTKQAVYDAVGNMFALGHYGSSWYVTKATTSGVLTEKLVNILYYIQMYIDKIGNVYLIDTEGTSDTYGNMSVRATKLSNNLEQQWQVVLGPGLVYDSDVMVTDSGLIYVQRATFGTKNGRVLDIYQQTNI